MCERGYGEHGVQPAQFTAVSSHAHFKGSYSHMPRLSRVILVEVEHGTRQFKYEVLDLQNMNLPTGFWNGGVCFNVISSIWKGTMFIVNNL